MARVRTAEQDMKHTWRFVYPFLRIVAAWPSPVTSSLLPNILQRCIIFITYFVQLMVFIPSIVYIFLKEKNRRKQMKLTVPHINALCQMSKYTILLYRTNEFRKTLDEIKNDWLSATEENRMIFRTNAKIGHRIVLILAIAMYSGGLCYRTILPLSKGKIVLSNNTTIRLLPCPSYFIFFNEQLTPNYEIIFVLQVLGGFLNYTTFCGTIGLCCMLCLHLGGLLKILTNKMVELTHQLDTNEQAVQEKIKDIVECHIKIKRFLNKVEQITPYLYFIEIIGDTCVVCMIGYCVIMEWENSNATAIAIYLVLQIISVLTTFAMCYVGQLLIDESSNIMWTSVTLNWYRFPLKKARYLILVITMSNYPIKLTAAKVVDISLATFTDIIKAAMGYLQMLRKVV